MKNYRKSKPGDVKCVDCVHYLKPFWEGARGRCSIGGQRTSAVGKNNTCDKAYHEKCSLCHDTGSVDYYHDAGDHFGMGKAPGSEWRKRPCKCQKGK